VTPWLVVAPGATLGCASVLAGIWLEPDVDAPTFK